MSNDLLTYLNGRLDKEITVMSEDLAKGTAKDHGEYKYACGIVRGLMKVKGIIAEVSHEMENIDD